MSADAKLYQDDEDNWCGVHDGECERTHRAGPYDLVALIEEINECYGHPIHRWILHVYPDGKAGLRGFSY